MVPHAITNIKEIHFLFVTLSSNVLHLLALDDLFNGGLENLWVGTDNLGDLLLALEDQEGWHGADAELLSDIWDLIDIKLGEVGAGVLVGESG